MISGRIWRCTANERNGLLVPLPEDWSLWDAASGLAVARKYAEPVGGWRCVWRSIDDNELKDSIVGWFKIGKQAKEFAEAQTHGQHYVVKRKRTKEEILRRAGVRGRLADGREAAGGGVFDYIERFYNMLRLHSIIGYISPVEFERQVGFA